MAESNAASNLSSDPLFDAALAAGLRGDLDHAIALFTELAEHHPQSPRAHYELGLAYQRRAEQALPATLVQQEPADAESFSSSLAGVVNAFLGLAVVGASRAVGQTDWIVRYRDDFRRSVLSFEHAIALDDAYAEAYYALAHSLRYLGRNDKAAEMAKRASELAPDEPEYARRAQSLTAALATAQISREEGVALTWDDVILPERTKRELRQMQLLLENPALSRDLGIDPPTGLLLYGPPGTGKTTIARVLAHQAHCRFYATSSAQINSMWLGESEKQVARLFADARANAPSIVFLDEIDALLPVRVGGVNLYSDKVVNQFLHEMDGLVKNRRVFVVGATNRRDMLDPALLRGGRLSRQIEIPLPNEPARTALFELCLKKAQISDDVGVEELARQTDGYSGANIKALVNEAGLQALIRIADTKEGEALRRLTMADFSEALAGFTPVEDPAPRWPFFR